MRHGILAKSSNVNSGLSGGGELSTEDMVISEDALLEAADIAAEADITCIQMERSVVIHECMASQESLSEDILSGNNSDNKLINSATIALAHESIDMALVALGAPRSEYTVSTEEAGLLPNEAFEVNHEGIKEVGKSIVAGVEKAFKEIAIMVKKIAAKVVVAMDGTGKKAKSMLKAFKNDKKSIIGSKFEDDVKEQLVKKTAGIEGVMTGSESRHDALARLTLNLEAVNTHMTEVEADVEKMRAITEEELKTPEGRTKFFTAREWASGKFKALKAILSSTPVSKSFLTIGKASELEITGDRVDGLNLDSDVGDKFAFYPTYVKGNNVHGVVFYVEESDSEGDEDPMATLHRIKIKNASVYGKSDSDLESEADGLKVWPRSKIEAELGILKDASKKLKSFSDARMKNIEKLAKNAAKQAKNDSGYTWVNRISGSEYNMIKVFVAGNYVSSIFAMANFYHTCLAEVAMHIKQYNK